MDAARVEPLSPDGAVRLEGVGEYRGALELSRTAAGVGAVNEVGLEGYLKGIAEMPAGWPAEALRAQAIAARTYALWVLQAGPGGEAAVLGAQICATEGCQAYAGLAQERAPNGAHWVAAVESTRAQVLLHQGRPILAKYSSSNGGRSIPGGRPYLRPIDDPDDARSPLHRWGLTVSYDDVGRALAAPGPVLALRRDGVNVEVAWTGPGGAPGHLVVPVGEFRAKLNAALPPPPERARTVPSPMFSLRADDGGRVAVLDGRGYGHGIGMSQYGAYGKALRRMKADAILAAYYGGIRPSTLGPDRLPTTVRVALDAGRPEVLVSASGPFRVLDGKGAVVAAVATGAWRVVPRGRGGLRLLPPPGQVGVPRVEVLGIDPPAPAVGQAVVVRFRARVPANVSVAAQPPGGAETEVLAPSALGTEEVSVTLSPSGRPGAYVVSITADAGAGRVATLPLAPQVVPPPGAVVRPPALARASRSAPPRLEAPGDPVAASPSAGDRLAAASPSAGDRLAAGAGLAALAVGGVWRSLFRYRRRLPAEPRRVFRGREFARGNATWGLAATERLPGPRRAGRRDRPVR